MHRKPCCRCRAPHGATMLTPESFWRRVDIKTKTECWMWRGKKNGRGYGQVYIGGGRKSGKLKVAHRIAWEFAYGPIPSSMFICHHCDTPPCCNPLHLFSGSMSDNLSDAASKGRCGAQRHSGRYEESLQRATAASVAMRSVRPWKSPGRTGQPHSMETRMKISIAKRKRDMEKREAKSA